METMVYSVLWVMQDFYHQLFWASESDATAPGEGLVLEGSDWQREMGGALGLKPVEV